MQKNTFYMQNSGVFCVGPDGLGRIPGPSIDILRKVAEMEGKL